MDSRVSWIPDSAVEPFVYVRAGLALVVVCGCIWNMSRIWLVPELVQSRARRWRMYAMTGTSILIAWQSSNAADSCQVSGGFSLGYQDLFSMAVLLIITLAAVFTFQEDVSVTRKQRSSQLRRSPSVR